MTGTRVDELLLRRDVAGLARVLDSKDAGTRLAAARALASIATSDPARPLISAGGEDESDRAIRLDAVQALERRCPNRAADLLAEALGDPNVERRLRAVEALASLGATAVGFLIVTLGRGGEDAHVRRAAALALEAIGGADAEGALRRYHGPARAVTVPEGADAATAGLVQFLTDPSFDADTRRGALLRLEHAGTPAAEDIVLQYHSKPMPAAAQD